MFDVETFLFQLLGRDLAQSGNPAAQGVTFGAAIDVHATDNIPALTYDASSDPSLDGPALFHFIVDFTVLGDGMDAAKQLALLVDTIVSGWDGNELARVDSIGWQNDTVLPDAVGWVNAVEPVTRFSRQPAPVIPERNVVQYSGSYALALRN